VTKVHVLLCGAISAVVLAAAGAGFGVALLTREKVPLPSAGGERVSEQRLAALASPAGNRQAAAIALAAGVSMSTAAPHTTMDETEHSPPVRLTALPAEPSVGSSDKTRGSIRAASAGLSSAEVAPRGAPARWRTRAPHHSGDEK
jgi:hypothetical protein